MGKSPKKPLPNPFYVAVTLVGTIFVLTCFGYLMVPYVQQQVQTPGAPKPSGGSIALAAWLDKNGAFALTVEVIALIVVGVLAMLTDPWFSDEKTS